MRRFVSLAVLLFFSIPFGLSMSGCGRGSSTAVVYCNSSDYGPRVGQLSKITLSPTLATTGESLNYGQIGQGLSASGVDCKGTAVTVRSFTYASTDTYNVVNENSLFADINPTTGQVCGGHWNRNTGGGVADFTICSPPSTPPTTTTALLTATANGVVSNPIAVYVHPVVTGIALGSPSACAVNATTGAYVDPATNCCPFNTSGTPVTAPAYNGSSCLSQGQQGQLVARVFRNGTTNAADNITCNVGHLNFSTLNASNVASIDVNGIATANQPGSAVVTASIANSSSAASAGFVSTCPPAKIVLSVPSEPDATSINVSLNNTQPLTATVTDTNGNQLTGLTLVFNSTTPQTIPVTGGSVTPIFPGAATITAVCEPSSCNTSPFSQIGYLGNGKPITSNGIQVTTAGTSSTVIYMASTESQYVQPRDFTVALQSAPIKLTYVPNSMVINQAGTVVYFGSVQGLMSLNTTSNAQGTPNTNVPGVALSVSPDNSTVVVTDPTRGTVSLYSVASSSVTTTYGGIATHAQWSPDSQTVYITTTGNALLTHSAFQGWQSTTTEETYRDVAVTVPSVGAYLAGNVTDGRSYCPSSTIGTTGIPPTVANAFAPLADQKAAITDRIAATTDGKHILGAAAAANGAPTSLSDLVVSLPVNACPTAVPLGYFGSTVTAHPLSSITAASITGVIPVSNSALAFVTYTGTGGVLPVYAPAATGAGTVSYVTLSGGATAPISGVVSTDNLTFFAGTTGDNQVHQFSISGTTVTETGVLNPGLVDANGNAVPVNLLVQHPKRTTS